MVSVWGTTTVVFPKISVVDLVITEVAIKGAETKCNRLEVTAFVDGLIAEVTVILASVVVEAG